MRNNNNSKFFYGWIILIASFVVMIMNSLPFVFGVFIKPMIAEFGWSRAATSAIFSVHMAIYSIFVIPMGLMYDKYGPRILIGFSGVVSGVSLILCSHTSSIWNLYLTYGVALAIGLSPLYLSSSSNLMKWFLAKRGLSIGIAVAGIGLGQSIWAIVTEHFINLYSWRMTFTIIGIVYIISLLLAALLMKKPESNSKVADELSWSLVSNTLSTEQNDFTAYEAIRTKAFWMFYFARTFAFFAGFMIMIHLVPFATDVGINTTDAIYALGLIGILGTIGRIIMGAVADKIGGRNTFVMCLAILTLIVFCLFIPMNVWILYGFSIIFGFLYGGRAAMHPLIVKEFFGLSHLGTIIAITSSSFGVGGMIGPIIGGYIFDVTGSYYWAFMLCLVFFSLALLFSLMAKTPKKGKNDFFMKKLD